MEDASSAIARSEFENQSEEPMPDAAHRPSRRDIPSLDGLRAISIIFVIAGHAVYGHSDYTVAILHRLANFGVRVFFVISGYLITTIVMRNANRTGAVQLGKFYLRRTLRISPPYCVTG